MNKKELKSALTRTNKELVKLQKYQNGEFDSGFEPYIYLTDRDDNELFRIHLKNFNKNYHKVITEYLEDYKKTLETYKNKIEKILKV